MAWLHDSKNLSWTGLRVYVAALNYHWTQVHGIHPTLTSHPDIVSLLRGSKSTYEPRTTEPSWDAAAVLNELAARANPDLAIDQRRIVLLLALCTAWRPRSDLGRISRAHLLFTNDDGSTMNWQSACDTENGPDPAKMTLVALLPKEGPIKRITLPRWDADLRLCPVRAVLSLLRRTRDSCSTRLFVRPKDTNTPASEDTLGRWTRDALQECGVNASAHSTRGTSASHALHHNAPLEAVLAAANWRQASTFRRFYWRQPTNNANSVSALATTVLTSALGPAQSDTAP